MDQKVVGAVALVSLLLIGLVPAADAQVAPLEFHDPEGDVAQGAEPYSGAGAATTDIVEVRLSESGSKLVFELQLRDLSDIDDELIHDGFHAQYAVSFVTRDGHAGFSTRATYGGIEYTTDPLDHWRFTLHDKQTDTWPAADGKVEGSTLVWEVASSHFSVSSGDTLSEWSVQTWNSYDHKEQYGDWAQTEDSYTIGTGATGEPAADEGPSADDTPTSDPTEPQLIPAPSFALGVIVLGAVVLVRTRRAA